MTMRSVLSAFRSLPLAALLLLNGGCAATAEYMLGQQYQPVDAENQTELGEVILVGKIRLDPSLDPYEQTMPSERWEKDWKGVLFAYLTDEPDTPVKLDGVGAFTNSLSARDGELFAVAVPRTTTNFRYLRFQCPTPGASGMGYICSSHVGYVANGSFEIPTAAEAVYIGTLIFHRDEFNIVKRVETKDEYREARRFVKEKLGRKPDMRKSLMDVYVN